MKVTENTLAEISTYLKDLQSLLDKLTLDKQIFTEGNTVDQIAFHVAQSANFYLRTFILNQEYAHDRDDEFSSHFSKENILESIEKALEACKLVAEADLDLDSPLSETRNVKSKGFVMTVVIEVILQATVHTAEHYGQLTSSID